MGLIEDFIARYRKEYDFYDQAARLVAQTLDVELQAAGIRSIVTSRAKSVVRLEAKVRKRSAEKPDKQEKPYACVDDIFTDIVDLAGARVALYFPGARKQVDALVKSLFVLTVPQKEFPRDADPPTYAKRFSGYWATHYRVQLREASLTEPQKRYAEARVEIQVASVLMHAWAEVDHDLVYKPLQGALSEEEYAILDELNGVVMAGEIALERLQRAGEARVAAIGRPFSNHYDLAAYLWNQATAIIKSPLGDNAIGRVDLLFDLLKRLKKATPEQLAPYVAALHADIERRPIAEQIVDRLLAEDESRYAIYDDVRRTRLAVTGPLQSEDLTDAPERHEAIGFFLSEWTQFERLVREATHTPGPFDSRSSNPSARALERLGVFDSATRADLDRIRRMRNNLIHGVEVPNPADLREAGERLRAIIASIGAPKAEP